MPMDVVDGRVDAQPLINVVLDNDQFPHLVLPGDLDTVTVKMIKHGLTDYMLAAWGMYLPFLDIWFVNNLTRTRTALWIFYCNSVDISQVDAFKVLCIP
jgi:hypothetical protein